MAVALDIRAQVTCSLGTLISGSISDSQPANSGLIFTRGSVRIVGSTPPSIGTAVTFSYDKWVNESQGGSKKITRKLGRDLYVIGASADATKNYVDVELGCRLTMLRNYAEDKRYTAADGVVSPSSGLDEADAEIVTLPLSANLIAQAIMGKLGISGSPNLTNEFSVASFDVSQGYVSALNDLFYSESKVGYMKSGSLLEVANANPLTSSSLSYVIDKSNLIEMSPLSIGDIPPLVLIGQYSYRTLGDPETDVDKLNWEKQESYGVPTTITVDNPVEPFVGGTAVWDVPDFFQYTYTPYTLVETKYDAYDRVVTRVTTERSILAEIAPSYLQHIAGKYVDTDNFAGTLTYTQRTPPEGSAEVDTITTQTFTYKLQAPSVFSGSTYPEGYEEILSEETVREEPVLKLVASTPVYSYAGGLSYDPQFTGDIEFTYGTVLTDRFVAERQVRTYETSKGAQGQQISKALTEQYLCHAYTQEGQQILADALQKISGRNPFDVAAAEAIFDNAQIVKRLGTSVEINSGREVSLQQRPPQGERTAQGVTTKQGEEAIGTGVGFGEGTVTIPYACDDRFEKQGASYVAISKQQKREILARLFVKTYIFYMIGLRNGLNITTVPEALPSQPMRGVTLKLNGVSAGFMPTALTYTMDANGIIASADLLLAGGAQGPMSQAWFPVAPGITFTAPALTETDTRPTNYLGQIATVGADAQTTLNAAYPSAVSGDGVQALDTLKFWVYDGSLWVDRGTSPARTYPAYTPVATTLTTLQVAAATGTSITVQSLPYALALLTELPIAGVSATEFTRTSAFTVSSAADTTIGALAPRFEASVAMRPPTADSTINALVPVVGREVGIYVAPATATMTITAYAPNIPAATWHMRPPAADMSVTANVPVVGRYVGVYADPPSATIDIAALAPTAP